MRLSIALVGMGLVACANDRTSVAPDASGGTVDAGPIDAAPPPPLSITCSDHFTLHGFNPQSPTIDVQPNFDTVGIAYCLTLDATSDFGDPDFYVNTLQTQGPRSPYELAMFDSHGALIHAGWNVTFGSSPQETFAHLESKVPVGTVVEAIVRVRMFDGVGTTKVSFSLFEPFD